MLLWVAVSGGDRPSPQARPAGHRLRRLAAACSLLAAALVLATAQGPDSSHRAVEDGLPVDRIAVAAAIEPILFDRRGWTGTGRISLQRVDAEPVNFRVTLASPAMTDRLCAPLRTRGRVSCENRGRAVLNFLRWRWGSTAWGSNLRDYRRYLVNHEVGHSLGHRHRRCPGASRRAPVMLQQTGGALPCRRGSWPLRQEQRSTPLPRAQP